MCLSTKHAFIILLALLVSVTGCGEFSHGREGLAMVGRV